MINTTNQNIFLPKWIGNKAISFYFVALLVINVIYFQFSLPWYYFIFGCLSVSVFFYYSNVLSKQWSIDKVKIDKRFEKKIFWFSFVVRYIYMTIIYIVFQNNYGNAFGFENGDPTFYDYAAKHFAQMITHGNYNFFEEFFVGNGGVDISDIGYSIYLGLIYFLTDNNIYISRVIKCILSAWTVIMMYRLSKSNFGDQTGRLTAIFCMLWPNFWYYCGTSLKETEMVFLSILFVEQADEMLRTRRFSVWKIVPILFISAILFTFRTALALVTILCLLFSIVMSSTKIIGWGKRILIGVLALGLIGITLGNSIKEQADELIKTVQSDEHAKNMEWRTKRDNGNAFAKYATKAVFAPLIFSIPFPSMINPYEGEHMQHTQELLNGGNYIKNILSFFVILVMFMLLFSGNWRNHLIPTSFLLGYLIVLSMSTFAQSERFHQPAMPFEMMFAAYGIAQVLRGVPVYKEIGNRVQYKRWFNIWVIFMFIAAIAWNWFKLAGRGLV